MPENQRRRDHPMPADNASPEVVPAAEALRPLYADLDRLPTIGFANDEVVYAFSQVERERRRLDDVKVENVFRRDQLTPEYDRLLDLGRTTPVDGISTLQENVGAFLARRVRWALFNDLDTGLDNAKGGSNEKLLATLRMLEAPRSDDTYLDDARQLFDHVELKYHYRPNDFWNPETHPAIVRSAVAEMAEHPTVKRLALAVAAIAGDEDIVAPAELQGPSNCPNGELTRQADTALRESTDALITLLVNVYDVDLIDIERQQEWLMQLEGGLLQRWRELLPSTLDDAGVQQQVNELYDAVNSTLSKTDNAGALPAL
jgi:hypothetical protein